MNGISLVSANLGVGGDDLESIQDLLLVHSATHIKEVGRFSVVQFDNVHCRHCQACPVY